MSLVLEYDIAQRGMKEKEPLPKLPCRNVESAINSLIIMHSMMRYMRTSYDENGRLGFSIYLCENLISFLRYDLALSSPFQFQEEIEKIKSIESEISLLISRNPSIIFDDYLTQYLPRLDEYFEELYRSFDQFHKL